MSRKPIITVVAVLVGSILAFVPGKTRADSPCGAGVPVPSDIQMWWPGWLPTSFDIVQWSFDDWPSHTATGADNTNWGRDVWSEAIRMAAEEWNNVSREQAGVTMWNEVSANGKVTVKALAYDETSTPPKNDFVKQLGADEAAATTKPKMRYRDICFQNGAVRQLRQVDIWINKGWHFQRFACNYSLSLHWVTMIGVLIHESGHGVGFVDRDSLPGGCTKSIMCAPPFGSICNRVDDYDKFGVHCIYTTWWGRISCQ